MRATAIEFRLRLAIMAAIVTLGFWAPWIRSTGRRLPLLERLALELSRTGLLSFRAAIALTIVVAALTAAVAAILRVWAAAYLGAETVNHLAMRAGSVMAGGPYRLVRNPLYLGSWMLFAALAFLMPPSGALFAMVLLTLFLLRLILGEEAFLAARLGAPYLAYRAAVPRLVPGLSSHLRRSPAPAEGKPRWGVALLAEINPIGVFLILAALSWRYDLWLMLRAILVSFGISLVVRAFLPAAPRQEALRP